MTSLIDYAHLTVAFLLIFLVFIQPSKGSIGDMMSSSSSKEAKKIGFATKMTFTLLILFFTFSFLKVYTAEKLKNDSIVIERSLEGK